MAKSELVEVSVAAQRIGCSEQHVRNLIELQALEARDIRSPGASRARWRVLRASLESYLEEARDSDRAREEIAN